MLGKGKLSLGHYIEIPKIYAYFHVILGFSNRNNIRYPFWLIYKENELGI